MYFIISVILEEVALNHVGSMTNWRKLGLKTNIHAWQIHLNVRRDILQKQLTEQPLY